MAMINDHTHSDGIQDVLNALPLRELLGSVQEDQLIEPRCTDLKMIPKTKESSSKLSLICSELRLLILAKLLRGRYCI